MLAKRLISRMNPTERSQVNAGAITTMMATGAFAYWNYRERIRKDFLRSEGHYKMSHHS
jgi:predicted molibdopterin-dependent oxidoreductase YjgC